MEPFETIVSGFSPLTFVIKNSILDVSGVLGKLTIFYVLANLSLIFIKKVQFTFFHLDPFFSAVNDPSKADLKFSSC